MNQQPKYVKGKDGKFQGSIGTGKTAVPSMKPAGNTATFDLDNLTQDDVNHLEEMIHKFKTRNPEYVEKVAGRLKGETSDREWEIVAADDKRVAIVNVDYNYPESPRITDDNTGVIIIPGDSSYSHWGDEGPFAANVRNAFMSAFDGDYEDEGFPAGFDGAKQYLAAYYGTTTILPVSVYDHSGEMLYVGKRGDVPGDVYGWDSSQVGFIVDTAETRGVTGVPADNPTEMAEILENEVTYYSDVINGEYSWAAQVFTHTDGVVDEDGQIECIAGFDQYGAEAEAQALFDHYHEDSDVSIFPRG